MLHRNLFFLKNNCKVAEEAEAPVEAAEVEVASPDVAQEDEVPFQIIDVNV